MAGRELCDPDGDQPTPGLVAAAAGGMNATSEPRWVKFTLLALALGFLLLNLGLPLIAVFVEAFRKGAGYFAASIAEPDAIAAMRLTLTVAAIAVPVNVVIRALRQLGHRQVRFPLQTGADHADRPALLGIARGVGPGLRSAVRAAGLVRRMAARPRPAGDLRRSRHRAGDGLRHLPVRGAGADPADAGPGPATTRRRRCRSAPRAGRPSAG